MISKLPDRYFGRLKFKKMEKKLRPCAQKSLLKKLNILPTTTTTTKTESNGKINEDPRNGNCHSHNNSSHFSILIFHFGSNRL